MKIFDCFTYNNERFHLKLRCEELKGLDVTHVLIESKYTFAGVEKLLHYKESNREFESYNIRAFSLEKAPNDGNAWNNERYQRNYIKEALYSLGAEDNDVVIISDADEIPKRDVINLYKPIMGTCNLEMRFFYFYLNCLHHSPFWYHPKVLSYKELNYHTADEIRMNFNVLTLRNAGWHFSYLNNAETIKEKIHSFSHQEYNNEAYTNLDTIKSKMHNGEDLFSDKKFLFIDIEKDTNYPEFVLKDIEKLKKIGYIR